MTKNLKKFEAKYLCSPIRIPSMDLDPGQPNSMWIRIHHTIFIELGEMWQVFSMLSCWKVPTEGRGFASRLVTLRDFFRLAKAMRITERSEF
jgi:hypothetical protein